MKLTITILVLVPLMVAPSPDSPLLNNWLFGRPPPQRPRADAEDIGNKGLRREQIPIIKMPRNAVNYDEPKQTPFPALPDPLVTKSGKVTSLPGWSVFDALSF